MLTELDLEVIEKKNIISFDISGVRLELFTRAVVQVIFTCKDNSIIYRDVIIEGDDYLQWSSDDSFILNYIVLNANKILSSYTQQ